MDKLNPVFSNITVTKGGAKKKNNPLVSKDQSYLGTERRKTMEEQKLSFRSQFSCAS